MAKKESTWLTIKPAVVLTVIVSVVSAVIIISGKTFVVDPNILDAATITQCVGLMGEGEYVASTDWESFGFPSQPDGVQRIITKVADDDSSKLFAVDVRGSGYNRDGVNLLVSFKDGDSSAEVQKIAVIAADGETPGIGDRVVGDESLAEQFIGKNSNELKVGRDIVALTGATRSSTGVTDAVNKAISAAKQIAGG